MSQWRIVKSQWSTIMWKWKLWESYHNEELWCSSRVLWCHNGKLWHHTRASWCKNVHCLVRIVHFEGTIEHYVVTIQLCGGRMETRDISMGHYNVTKRHLFHNEASGWHNASLWSYCYVKVNYCDITVENYDFTVENCENCVTMKTCGVTWGIMTLYLAL